MFTKAAMSPSSPSRRERSAGCWSVRLSRAVRRLSPSASTVRAPPAIGRRTGGRRKLAISGRCPRGRQAKLLVVDVLDRAGVGAADGAVRVAAQPHLVEARIERVEQDQPAGRRLADLEQQLERLAGLQRA